MTTNSAQEKTKKQTNFFRTLFIVLFIGIAGGILLSGNLLIWTGNTLVDNQKFTATTSPLIKQPSIQKAISTYTTNQIFQGNDVQDQIAQVLPPKASFLAPTIAAQLKPAVNKTLLNVLAKPKVQDLWNQSLTKTHNTIIATATNYKGNGVIDLSQLLSYVASNLSNTKLSFLSKVKLPPKFGNIVILKSSLLPIAHRVVVNLKPMERILEVAFLVFSILAVLVAKKRRTILIKMSIVYSFVMLTTIISLRIIKLFILNTIDPAYKQAAADAYSIVFKSFYHQSIVLLGIFALVGIIAYLTGQYKNAIKIKLIVQNIFSTDYHKLIFNKENSFTIWLSKNTNKLNVLLIVVAIIILCFFSLSLSLILNSAIVLLLTALVIRILSAPHNT